jgi:tRNA modification GTPase
VLAHLDPGDTIAAVASPPGQGVRGLVRISGRNAWRIALDGFRTERVASPPRHPELRHGALVVEGLRPLLPAMIALWPGPRTYTGQDLAEIHTVGALPLLTQVLAGCLKRGARPARSGEFTLRAFLSGRIDLTRAEAVLGVIEARNGAQLDAALGQLAGGLSKPIHDLRNRLLDVVAHLEANLDFADESDVDPLGRAALAEELESSAVTLSALTDRLTRRDRAAGNPRVVVLGPPNAGKSRLFNALLGHDRAIVSPRSGTTRDYLTGTCEVGGIIVELIDTAGIDLPRDPIETQAQANRADQADQADLLLLCTSHDTWTDRGKLSRQDRPALWVWTKCDLGRPEPSQASTAILTSAATGEGLDELRASIARLVRASNAEAVSPSSTSARCRESLEGARTALNSASQTLRDGGGEELVALDLRLALDELGKVVGAVVTDDILDRIFQRFCIGK